MSDPADIITVKLLTDQRGVICTESLGEGRIVVTEQAYCTKVYPDTATLYCDCCLKPSPPDQPLLRCSGCKLAHYINKDHQKAAWKRGHKEECAAIRSITLKHPPTPTVLLVLKTILEAARNNELQSEPEFSNLEASPQTQSGYKGVLSLLTHWDDLTDENKIHFAQMAVFTHQLLQTANAEAAKQVTPRDIAMMIARFSCNLHTICDDELHPIGIGIFPLISMINHSCTPNCVQSFVGDKMTIRSLRPINEGEEVTISYVELAATRWERRKSLLESYFFDIDLGTGNTTASKPHFPPGGALECEDNIALEVYPTCPWPCDERDKDLTYVSIYIDNKNLGFNAWGDLGKKEVHGGDETSETNFLEKRAAKSFGIVEEETDSNDQMKPSSQRDKVSVSKSLAFIHCWDVPQESSRDNQAKVIIDNTLLKNFAIAYAQALQALESTEKQPQTTTTIKMILSSIDTLTKGSRLKLGPLHILRLRLYAALLRHAISAGNFELALQTARDLVPIYEYVYPTIWPALGLHYATLAKLEHYLGNFQQASLSAHSAIVVLEAGMGSGREVLHDMERIRREAAGEYYESQRPPEERDYY